MAFTYPKHQPHMSFELIRVLLVAILLLLSLWIAYRAERSADRALLAVIPIAQPAMAQEKLSMATPTSPMLKATIHATSLETALIELLKGPAKVGEFSEIPEGTELLGVAVKGNIVTVNLSREFTGGAGATSVIERVEELKKTVRGINNQYRMKLAVEGKPLTILTGDGLELDPTGI